MKNVKMIGMMISLLAALLLVVGPMAGCGSKKKDPTTNQVTEVNTTTKGQELQDLDAAHKKGIITDDEYADQKARILAK